MKDDGEILVVCEECGHVNHVVPSAQPETCDYWDSESNYCALNKPSAQPTHDDGSNALDALDCVAQRKGKWIVYYHGGTWLSYECNLCRHSSMDRTPFCSYCGSRMECCDG